MTHQTIVVTLSPAEQREFRAKLSAADFETRIVDHAQFSVRGERVVATLYHSGKLVVQGSDAEPFVERYLGNRTRSASVARVDGSRPSGESVLEEHASIGGDESGKGDYFGPLVVAAIRLDAGDAEKLRAGGVADSKQVSDTLILRQAPLLREHFPHALRIVDPPEYNRRHGVLKNVALLLAELYREVMSELARPGDMVLIDQFSKNRNRLEKAMEGLGVKLLQSHKAERFASVAAASFLARAAFLERLKELSDEVAVDLPKGAGPPVERAARRFLEIHGPDRLGVVAKLHFKTTEKIIGRRK